MTPSARMGLLALALTLLTLVSLAVAQYPTFETGYIDAVIDGVEYRVNPYATEVPDNAADNATNDAERKFLARIAGQTQHSASFAFKDERTVGNMVVAPAMLQVAISTRSAHPDGATVDSLLLQFALHPGTLELLTEVDVEVSYFPRGSSYDDYYALTDGTLDLHSVEFVDAQTLTITGMFSGTLTHQDDYDVVHNPDDALTIEAKFVVEQVVMKE